MADPLQELGVLYEAVADAQAKYESKADAAKTAKKTLEAATNALLEKVRECTKGLELPLFDADEREHDLEAMVAGGDTPTDAGR